MRWPSLLAAAGLALALRPAIAQERVTLDDALRLASGSPRVAAARRELEASEADRQAAAALPNPTVSVGRSRPGSGDRTIFDAASQDQVSLELPLPLFGQRGARIELAERQARRAATQVRLAETEARRLAALAFARLLAAQEALAARRAALAEAERIRGLVAGRLAGGVASRYDLSRAEAEVASYALAVQRTEAEVLEHGAALAAVAGRPGWRPEAAGSLVELQRRAAPDEASIASGPAAELARGETLSAQARVTLAERERFPVPALSVGRTWTHGPFGAANFIGLSSEIPLFDTRRAQADRAKAEAIAARERERATLAALDAERARHLETLRLRRAALERLDAGGRRPDELLEMAESAYRLGRATLFELLDARRTRLEATVARIELLEAIVESQIELLALGGRL